jgi:ribosomal-protein-serine acetyltransferase
MVLYNDQICIRPYQPDDVAKLYEAAHESLEHVGKYLDWCHMAYSLADAEQWVSSRANDWQNEHYSFVISPLNSSAFLGGIGINFVNRVHQFANLGYWIRKSALGNNIAVQAVHLAANFAFSELNMQRLEIVTALDNYASQRVAEKAGAHREGVLPQRLCLHGKNIDAVMYSLIPSLR